MYPALRTLFETVFKTIPSGTYGKGEKRFAIIARSEGGKVAITTVLAVIPLKDALTAALLLLNVVRWVDDPPRLMAAPMIPNIRA
jgi:hypothetical protein